MTRWIVARVWSSRANARSDDYSLEILPYPVAMIGRRIETISEPFDSYEEARVDLLRRYGALS